MSTSEQDLAALREDFANLKKDVLGLMDHLKSGMAEKMQAGSHQINDGASKVFQSVSAGSDWSANAISAKVEAQPLAALLIAGAIGFIGGRVLLR